MGTRSNNEAPLYLTSDKSSPAYSAVKDVWPKVVTGAIDDVHRTSIFCNHEAKASEGKKIVANLATFKYEIQHDRQLTPLPDDGHADIDDYNAELKELGARKWFDMPWLFAECYLYRRIHTSFSLSTHWKAYDVFARQKLATLRSSLHALCVIVRHYDAVTARSTGIDTREEDEARKETVFRVVCFLCLSADSAAATTLSMSSSTPLGHIYQSLTKGPPGTISLILSQTPDPLLPILLLAAYMLKANLATKIILHSKSIPWSVTDATASDIKSLLSFLADPESFFRPSEEQSAFATGVFGNGRNAPKLDPSDRSSLQSLAAQLNGYIKSGILVIKEDPFWTSPYSFWDLPTKAPGLWKEFQEAEAVIFAGLEGLGERKIKDGRKGVGGIEEMGHAWGGATSGVRAVFIGGGKLGVQVFDGKEGGVISGNGEGEDGKNQMTDFGF